MPCRKGDDADSLHEAVDRVVDVSLRGVERRLLQFAESKVDSSSG